MNRISDFQVVTLRTGQVVLQFVIRDKEGSKSVQRVFATSKVDAISRIIQLEGYANGWDMLGRRHRIPANRTQMVRIGPSNKVR